VRWNLLGGTIGRALPPSTAMQLVMLAGELGEKYGTQHEYYNLRTPADAIKLLCLNYPRLQKDLVTAHQNGVGYKLIQSGAAMGYDELHLPFGSRPMMLVPVISGSQMDGGLGTFLIGAALVAVAIAIPYVGFSAAAGGFAAAGAGVGATGAIAAATTAGIFAGQVGIALMLAGTAQMLSPQPQVPKLGNNRFDGGTNVGGTGPQGITRGASGQQSYGFTGPANTVGIGATVPVIYGEVITGGHLLAVNLEVTDESEPLATSITRPTVSETTINSERLTRDLKSAAGLEVKRLSNSFDIRTNQVNQKIRINEGFGNGQTKDLIAEKTIKTSKSGSELNYKKEKRKAVDIIFKLENGLFDRVSGSGSTKIPGYITYEVRLTIRGDNKPDVLAATARTTVQGLFNPNDNLTYGQRLELPKVNNGDAEGIKLEVEIIDVEATDRTTFVIAGYGYNLL